MTQFTAVLDACVLYPAPLRDFLLHLAREGMFRARWTDEIHNEWTRNLLANRPDLKKAQLQRTRELMNRAVPECLIAGHLSLVPSLRLPDPDDRHVLAAAIHGNAQVIVTFNEKDFPLLALAPFNVKAQHPDTFIVHLISTDLGAVCDALRNQRAFLKNPPISPHALLATLEKQGLPRTASKLRPMTGLI